MRLASLDHTTLTALMVAGALFALGGLWLMYRPRHSSDKALIDVLGLKVESSSTGLIVFIVGAAFLAVPLFAPRAPAPAAPAAPAGQRIEVAAPAVPGEVVLRRPAALTVEGSEAEPNDSPASANAIPLGVVLIGQIAGADRDVFWVEMPPDLTGQLVVNARGTEIDLRILDDAGGQIARTYGMDTATIRHKIDGPGYFIVIEALDRDARPSPYQLTVATR